MPTGEASGIDAVDTDPRNGCGTWFEDNDKRIPATRIHTTRGGGKHILFCHAPGLGCSSDTRIHAGVDVKADGGYIIWHPASGCDVWLDWELAAWPDWLLLLARAGQRATHESSKAPKALAPPSAQAVVELLDRLPNPLQVDRGQWIAILLAARGCVQGLEAIDRCTPDEADAIKEAACAWSDRWEGGSTVDVRAKWDEDLMLRETPLAGWENLQRHAAVLIPGYRLEQAQSEFTAVPLPDTAAAPDARAANT